MKLNISRPSADAPDSMAIYDKLRQMSADENASTAIEDILSEVVSGLFNIVAKLESESGGGSHAGDSRHYSDPGPYKL